MEASYVERYWLAKSSGNSYGSWVWHKGSSCIGWCSYQHLSTTTYALYLSLMQMALFCLLHTDYFVSVFSPLMSIDLLHIKLVRYSQPTIPKDWSDSKWRYNILPLSWIRCHIIF
jgi:hypothetical protein